MVLMMMIISTIIDYYYLISMTILNVKALKP